MCVWAPFIKPASSVSLNAAADMCVLNSVPTPSVWHSHPLVSKSASFLPLTGLIFFAFSTRPARSSALEQPRTSDSVLRTTLQTDTPPSSPWALDPQGYLLHNSIAPTHCHMSDLISSTLIHFSREDIFEEPLTGAGRHWANASRSISIVSRCVCLSSCGPLTGLLFKQDGDIIMLAR